MTATLDRPVRPRPGAPLRSSHPLGPGLLAAGWAAGAGLVCFAFPVLLAWATDSRSGSGATAAVRSIGQLWLLAHGASFAVPGGVVGLTPLGLVLLPLLLLHRAGRHGARSAGVSSLPDAARLVVAIALPYSVVAAVLAALSATEDVRPAPVQSLVGGLLVGTAGAALGVLREAHVVPALPPRMARTLVGTAAATAAIVGAGALLAGLSLLMHAGRASSLAGATDPGVVGGLTLLLLGLACVPNGAVWGASWIAGPGFAVGVGTSAGPFGTTLGAVPALPLLAALPSGEAPGLAALALLVPVAGGVAAGVLVGRRLSCAPGRAAAEAAVVGPAAGLVMAALAYLSGGPLGGGRLADVGPSPWQLGLAVLLEVGIPAAATAAYLRRR
jgi:hypothetical protein